MSEAVGSSRVLFSDNFNKNGTIDSAKWMPNVGPGSFLGGTTQQRPTLPVAQNGVLKLQLDTYNSGNGGPKDGGAASFYGSEAISRTTFSRDTSGVAFEAKIRLPVAEKGLIGGFFTYGGNETSPTGRDEIDWEFIPSRGPQNPQTNIFVNEQGGTDGAFQAPTLPGVNLTDFHTYRIEWLPGAVRWLVDGEVVRIEKGAVPTKDMALHLNLWGAGASWDSGNPNLVPVGTPGANRTFFMEVDYTKVEALSVLNGNRAANLLQGTDAGDWILGNGGSDTLIGGDGNDSLFGGHEAEADADAPPSSNLNAYDEQLFGGAGDDLVRGGRGAEWLSGGSGDDTVQGGSGNDVIIGGHGSDRLSGGEGEDLFLYRTLRDALPTEPLDRIVDFNARWGDRIDLSRIDADTGTDGNQAFSFIGDAEFSGSPDGAGELRTVALDGSVRVEADVDGDGIADMAFLVFDIAGLTPEDFIL